MVFEFTPDPEFDFISAFARFLKVETNGHSLLIPEWLGKGFIRRINLAPEFQLLVHHYQLREELILKRLSSERLTGAVRILFNIQQHAASANVANAPTASADEAESAIRITSDHMDSQMYFSNQNEIYFVILGVPRDRLKTLLALQQPNHVVQTILDPTASYLFYESMSPNVSESLRQLTAANADDELGTLYCKIKVQELIYLLFAQLLKRNATRHYPINKADADKLFLVKATILADLAQPPKLARLAQVAGLSETKMTELFKQVFGDSIYNYYQKARLEKAALLIRSGQYSVSQVGYLLGFVNLSHFSRLFAKYTGRTPKKYSSGG